MIAALAWTRTTRARPTQTRPTIPTTLIDYAGTKLAALIDDARQQAIADGVRAVPPAVYRALLGYFPAALLQRCRFASGSARALRLPGLTFAYGDACAVTVCDVVLLKSERMAESDLGVWAHELTHVMQYQRWGVDGFADRYVRESALMEQEAIDNSNRFLSWRAEQ